MDVWTSIQRGVGGAWDYLQTTEGYFVWGFWLLLAALVVLHWGAAGAAIRAHAKSAHRALLKDVHQKLASMQKERDDARGAYQAVSDALAVARPYQDALGAIEAGLAEMRRVWLEHGTVDTRLDFANPDGVMDPDNEPGTPPAEAYARGNESSCEQVLRDNLWVLYPEYVVQEINSTSRVPLSDILRAHFADATVNAVAYKAEINLGWRPDICGWFLAKSALHPGFARERVYVLIELKNSQEPVRRKWMEQAHAYALALMLRVDQLWGQRIECLVVGSEVPADVNDVELSWGAKRHDSIRITPMSYRQLYERAEWMAANFLPRAAEAAPVTEPEAPEPRRLEPEAPIMLPAPASETVTAVAEAAPEEPLELVEDVEIVEPAAVPALGGAEPAARLHVDDRQRHLHDLLARFHGRRASEGTPPSGE